MAEPNIYIVDSVKLTHKSIYLIITISLKRNGIRGYKSELECHSSSVINLSPLASLEVAGSERFVRKFSRI